MSRQSAMTAGLAAALMIVAPTVRAADAPAEIWSAKWAADSIWRDGQAEVSHYDSTRSVYGGDRRFETVIIVVCEDFDPVLKVKADPPLEGRSLLPVLKANIVMTIPTDNYEYQYMTSTFVKMKKPRELVKQVTTTQEWCGTTLKMVEPSGMTFHSYWDGQGDGKYPFDLKDGDFTEEQLVLSLRGLNFASLPLETSIRVLSNQTNNKAEKPSLRAAKVSATLAPGPIRTAAGEFETYRVEVAFDGGNPMVFHFDKKTPHTLIRADYGDGRTLALSKTSRRIYWGRPKRPGS